MGDRASLDAPAMTENARSDLGMRVPPSDGHDRLSVTQTRQLRRLLAQCRSVRIKRLVVGLLCLSAGSLCAAFAIAAVSPTSWLVRFSVFVVTYALVVMLGLALDRHLTRSETRRCLRRMGLPICIICGYDLRGLEQCERCPECGREIEGTQHADPRELSKRSA